jgi:hypothetical protein
MGMRMLDIAGQRFGRLTVIGFAGVKAMRSTWLCRCDCGQEVTVMGKRLSSGHTRSCGCLQKEKAANNGRSAVKYGDRSHRWTGGRNIDGQGYAEVRSLNHPKASSRGYVREHVLVMGQMLGFPVPEGAEIHHCNGDRADNRPYNLRLFHTKGEHTSYHARLRQEGR